MQDRGAQWYDRKCHCEETSWGAGPGRARRPARTGLFIIAGGASSAMNDASLP
jgi:hypothetical protein